MRSVEYVFAIRPRFVRYLYDVCLYLYGSSIILIITVGGVMKSGKGIEPSEVDQLVFKTLLISELHRRLS